MTPSQTPEAGEAWLARSRATVAALPLAARAQALGRVEHIADGIAQVSGLPDARLEIIRGAGHMLHAEAHRAFHDVVLRFAKDIGVC